MFGTFQELAGSFSENMAKYNRGKNMPAEIFAFRFRLQALLVCSERAQTSAQLDSDLHLKGTTNATIWGAHCIAIHGDASSGWDSSIRPLAGTVQEGGVRYKPYKTGCQSARQNTARSYAHI